ncbi:hypothetical protein CEUSTIGMA_g2631.t1 [Chlamydomonas eustigma]|uniref:ornithine decarboxylase n=1 Tax=Chlamydomonas eustigma TaxID=1157962 RepID=A0A250WWH3_9CHLO|nr:hypothetical protein CEUSTIGMA_g2631.t1 [Chlamydomonas eustigma]|eukprot:GAX75187.1 hypothetical protein CEUSTIGMA_g2631.t1 [Chlamydomonas eustigma]
MSEYLTLKSYASEANSVQSVVSERPSLDTEVAVKLFRNSVTIDDLEPFAGELLTDVAVNEDDTTIRRVVSRALSLINGPTINVPLTLTSQSKEQMLKLTNSVRIDVATAESWVLASEYLKNSWQFQKTGRASAAAVLSDVDCEHLKKGGPQGIKEYALEIIKKHNLDDNLYIYDLGNVVRMFRAWRSALPRITPYYAIKCNPEPAMLRLLMSLGAGFDCASQVELATVLAIGMPSSKIIFAHPCKRRGDIEYAGEHNVEFTTFDTDSELDKIAKYNPRFRCVLRIRADDPEARVPLGLKYGASLEDVPTLLEHAKRLGLKVAGVSFHVGSGAKNMSTFSGAITSARHIFDLAEMMGFHMELLDIGGGFTGHFDENGNVIFGETADAINEAIEAEFPPNSGVTIIAEPGRYFAETSATMFTPVYGVRDRPGDASHYKGIHKDYWITDGLYGSFNCILYDDQRPEYQVLRSPLLEQVDESTVETFKSTVWGPTCDSADCVYKDVMLPELRNGDWLMFPNAGAYTVAGACDFNGINMTRPRTFYVFSDSPIDRDFVEE